MGNEEIYERTEEKKLRAQEEDADLAVLSRKAEIARLRHELGPDWKDQLKDAGVSIWRYFHNPDARKNLEAMSGPGQQLRDLNNPMRWRR